MRSRLSCVSLICSLLLCAALVQAQFTPAARKAAAAKPALTLPPGTDTSAKFYGNETAITASPYDVFAMQRKPNCSLTAVSASGTVIGSTLTSFTIESSTLNYEQVIHAAAGLTTTPDQFAGGCQDPNIGTASNNVIYVGQTPSGLGVLAVAAGTLNSSPNASTLVGEASTGMFVSSTAQPAPPDGSIPVSALSGDLTGNGINDLITVNWLESGGASVTVYLGKTDGSFTLGQTYALPSLGPGTSAQSAVLDDFNGDGILDLVVATGTGSIATNGSQITFLPGNGDGTFGMPKTMTVTGNYSGFGSLADGLVSGDFNNDGKKDLVSGYGLVFLGNGDGTFTQLSTPAFPRTDSISGAYASLAVGDFNKDGKLDLAVGSGQTIAVYLGNGDGTFTAGKAYASITNYGYLTATDLDGDGNLDLYSGDATNGFFLGDLYTLDTSYALMGNGDGTFRGAPRSAGTGQAYAYTSPFQSVEDLNGDGRPDYVAAASTSTGLNMQTYLGNGDGSFNPGSVLSLNFTYNGTAYSPSSLDSFVLMDVNADGHPDLVILPVGYNGAYPSRQGLLVALGNANGSFQTPIFYPFPSLLANGGSDLIYGVTGLLTATAANGTPELLYSFETTESVRPNTFYYVGFATQLSNGDGTLAAPVVTDSLYSGTVPPTFTAPTPALNLVDVNGDKTPDLITYVAPVFIGRSPAISCDVPALSWQQRWNVRCRPDHQRNGRAQPGASHRGRRQWRRNSGSSRNRPEFASEWCRRNRDCPGQRRRHVQDANQDASRVQRRKPGGSPLYWRRPRRSRDPGGSPPYNSGLFPGNGDGTFKSVASGFGDGTVMPPQPINIVATGSTIVADINGDGKPDIAGTTFLINNYGAPASPAGSTTALQVSSTSIAGGQSVTLTATVAALSGSIAPTGTVTFLNGSTPLGSQTINAQGVAVLVTSTLPVGSDPITAIYSGNANFLGSSASTSITITVAGPSSNTALESSLNPSQAGQPVTITATVTSTAGTPAGTVTFKDGATTLGLRTLNAGAQATYVSSTLAVGTHSITAVYAGSTSFGASTSPALSQVVNQAAPPGLPLLLSLSPGTVNAGTAQFTLTVMGENFTSNSVVLWNGQVRATTLVSSTELQATILASDIAADGTELVTVANSSATSAALPFAVQSSVPMITGASLAAAPDAGGNYQLTLTGMNFLPTSTVRWNSSTTLVSSNVNPWTITAVVPASDYASRPATVTVSNSSTTSLGFVVH